MRTTRPKAGVSDDSIAFASVAELSGLLRRRRVTPVELAELFLNRIERAQPALNAFITITRERALADAKASARRFAKGAPLGPLDGIPIALKDNIWTAGIRTTTGSKILGSFVPSVAATAAEKLRAAGTILLGKTNMHEFAYGVSTENPHYGAAHNPWDVSCSTGGSSGGSGAAVSAGLCVGSIGTDTGGSIRIPSALCGVVGLKPTFGRVSCYGTVPLAPSFDHVGPMARTVFDGAVLYDCILGGDTRDATTAAQPESKSFANIGGIRSRLRPWWTKKKPLILGIPRDYFFDRLDPEIREAVNRAAKAFERAGARIHEIPLAEVCAGDEPSTAIALAEATHVHRANGWFPEHAAEYGEDVIKRLQLGSEIRAADFLAAQDACEAIRDNFSAALERFHAILVPTTPIAAPKIGQKVAVIGGQEETVRSALIRLNRPANLTGLPAMSIPCGQTQAGLPIGLQIIGRAWREWDLLAIASLFESITTHSERCPDSI